MSRFIHNEDNTITDTRTGLTWSQKTIASDVTHPEAEEAVENLGEGWRLPTVEELFSLVDHTCHRPAIDKEAFPDTENDCYWTSTETAWNTSARWVVGFGIGSVGGLRNGYACVRAVRAGQ